MSNTARQVSDLPVERLREGHPANSRAGIAFPAEVDSTSAQDGDDSVSFSGWLAAHVAGAARTAGPGGLAALPSASFSFS